MPFGGLVVNRVHLAPDRRARRRPTSPRRALRAWTTRPASSRPSPTATPRACSGCAARWAAADGRRSPSSDDVHDLEGLALVRAYLSTRAAGGLERLSPGWRRLEQVVEATSWSAAHGSRWPQRTSRRIARRQPPRSTISSRPRAGRTGPRSPRARADRLATGGRAARGPPASAQMPPGARQAVVAGAGVGEQGADDQQPVGQRLERARALAAELEAPQRPGELAAARGAAGDERAERAQRVLLVGAEQAVAGARRRPVASGTRSTAPPSVRAQAVGPSDGSASSHSRSAVCSRRSRRPASSSARPSPAEKSSASTARWRTRRRAARRARHRASRRGRARARRRALPRRTRSRAPRRRRARPTACSRRSRPPRARRTRPRSARDRRRSRSTRPRPRRGTPAARRRRTRRSGEGVRCPRACR